MKQAESQKHYRRKYKTPRQVYTQVQKKGVEYLKRQGIDPKIDWVYYAVYMLQNLYYPYYRSIKQRFPDRKIWLVQDNAPSHTKARRILETLGLSPDIWYLNWPPNSPDLYPIEETFGVSKKYWDSTGPTTSCSHAAFQQVSELVTTTLQIGGELDSQIRKYTTIERFRKKCIQCIEHGGNNDWHG